MSPLNHKRTTSSLAPPIFYVAKNWQLKDIRLPIGAILQQFQIMHWNFSANVAETEYSVCPLIRSLWANAKEITITG